MKKLQSILDWFPHWVFVGIALALGAFVQNLKDQPDFLSAIFTWNTANLVADLKMAGAFALTAVIAWLRTDPWTVAANKMAAARKATTVPPMTIFMLAFAVFLLAGCISVSPTVPVTPDNQAKIASCQSTATLHNGFVLGGIAVGAVSAGMAGVAAASPNDKNLQMDAALVAAGAAGVAALATGGAGLTAASFTSNRCTEIVTPLPMAKPPQSSSVPLLPSFSEM